MNYDNNRKNKPSLEIESNRTPKISELKIPDSNRRHQERRDSSNNYNNNLINNNNSNNAINNINNNNILNSHSDYNKEKNKYGGKKSNRDSNQSAGVIYGKKGNSAENIHNVNNNAYSKGDSEKELMHINNPQNNNLDRRRSGSRTSQDERADKSNLKEFIKNMRDNVIYFIYYFLFSEYVQFLFVYYKSIFYILSFL